MARAPKVKAPDIEDEVEEVETKVSQSTALTNWEEELARQADAAMAQEKNTGGGQFFSIKSGILSFNDQAMPNNEMVVVIADSVLENVFYEGDYDPDNLSPPVCFAYGRDDLTMGPHETVIEAGQAQHEKCHGCPMNEFGTAERGKGKACKNVRRLGLIAAGELKNGRFEPYPLEDMETASVGFMKVPVMSIKGYATYVKQIAGALRLPPHAVYTRVKVVPDPKSQFRVLFEPAGQVSREIIPTLMKRHEEVKATIEFPYPLARDEAPEPEKPAAKGRSGKPAPVKNVRPPVRKKY